MFPHAWPQPTVDSKWILVHLHVDLLKKKSTLKWICAIQTHVVQGSAVLGIYH